MKAILVHINLKTPLLFPGISNGEENSRRTLTYIPGSALRGAVIARYPATNDLAADEHARQLFFSKHVRFLNGYPAIADHPSLPTPASWRKTKGAEEQPGLEIADSAFELDKNQKDKIERVGKSFCLPVGSNGWAALSPERELNLHIAGEGRGSVKADQNTLFQYEALAPGQTFIAAIISDDEILLEEIRGLLSKSSRLSLGRSRSAEYGQAVMQFSEAKTWDEVQTAPAAKYTTITLLSDMLIRDEHGQPTHDLDQALSRCLGGKPVKNERAFVQPVVVSGYNRKWGLSLPQFPALGMGSVFVYRADQVSAANLQMAVEQGLGERLVDGYGRIAVNLQTSPSVHLASPNNTEAGKDASVEQAAASIAPKIVLSDTSQALARTMAERLLRRTLDDLLLEKTQSLEIKGKIQNHQLARVRSATRRALADPDKSFKPLENLLGEPQSDKNQPDKPRLKETARKQLEGARVDGQRLLHWLRERLKNNDAISRAYLDPGKADAHTVAGEQASVSAVIQREYTLRLIERLVDIKMKRNREDGKE